MPTIPTLKRNSTRTEVRAWIRKVLPTFGFGFHFDTDPDDYTDDQGRQLAKGTRIALRVSVQRIFEILGPEQPYEVGARVFEKMWKRRRESART